MLQTIQYNYRTVYVTQQLKIDVLNSQSFNVNEIVLEAEKRLSGLLFFVHFPLPLTQTV